MNPANNYQQIRHDQALGFQDSITRFAENCLSGPDCPLVGDAVQGVAQIEGVVAALDQQPYLSPAGKVLSGSRALGFIESSMYFPSSGWPLLQQVLGPALAGNFEPMTEAAYSDALMVNPADSPYLSVMCIDFQTSRDIDQPSQLAPKWAAEASLSGANRAWSLQACETWPVPPDRTPAPVAATGSGPILILNTTHDPATPRPWARALNDMLANSALVEVDTDGHIAYEANQCVIDIVEPFLFADAPLPAKTSQC